MAMGQGCDCAGSCTGSCVGACDNLCVFQCVGVCNSGCTQCTSCTGTCIGCTGYCNSCSSGCYQTCNTDCTGGCTSSCTTACSYDCTYDCTGSCTGTCQGCTGCTACTGTCSGYCDTACTATNTAQIIADLGLNIRQKGMVLKTDFINLKTALRNEFSRRNKSLPTNDTYTITPANGIVIFKEQASKVFGDVHTMDTSKNYAINSGNIIMTNDMSATISYIQTLMSQNTKR